MRKLIFFVLTALISLTASAQGQFGGGRKAQDCDGWVSSTFQARKTPPFSFEYDGVPSSRLLGKWRFAKASMPSAEPSEKLRSYSWTDPRTGLQLECRVKTFTDFDAMEWVIYLRNISDTPTGTISQFKSLDLYQPAPGLKGDWTLFHADGAQKSATDFHAETSQMAVGDTLMLHPMGGRSSSHRMPYFNVKTPAGGMVYAIGWTGDWQAVVGRPAADRMRVEAGLMRFESYLEPGEEIRMPSVVLVPWKGEDRMDGQNILRRLIMAHYHPKAYGEPVKVPLLNNFNNFMQPWPCDEYSCLTADLAKAVISRQAMTDVLVDGYWLDAGWFSRADDAEKGYWWHNSVGNWTPDPERFPDGLSPISDAVHASGGKMMVWYEPERANVDSDWAHEVPQFMLSSTGEPAVPVDEVVDSSFIFNLGDKAAREWLTEYMVRHLTESKVDIYRQDFNIEPRPFWIANDKPGRIGMCEVHYVNGLYAYLDALRERLPYLIIDNCAGGGRRLDIEMTRRSIPMWRDDYPEPIENTQCHGYGLSQWLPVHCTATGWGSRYQYISTMAAGTVFTWGLNSKASMPQQKQIIAAYRRYSPYFLEDFYPLSGYGDLSALDTWLAYQYHRPSDESGIVVAFRRKDCTQSDYVVRLRGLDPAATYVLQEEEYENAKKGNIVIMTPWNTEPDDENASMTRPEPVVATGAELMEGFTISIPKAKAPKLFHYQKSRL